MIILINNDDDIPINNDDDIPINNDDDIPINNDDNVPINDDNDVSISSDDLCDLDECTDNCEEIEIPITIKTNELNESSYPNEPDWTWYFNHGTNSELKDKLVSSLEKVIEHKIEQMGQSTQIDKKINSEYSEEIESEHSEMKSEYSEENIESEHSEMKSQQLEEKVTKSTNNNPLLNLEKMDFDSIMALQSEFPGIINNLDALEEANICLCGKCYDDNNNNNNN